MSAEPRVVIGVPVYNHAAYLEAALRSLLEQTYRALAVIVIDDRSPDDSLAIAHRLAAEDRRVEVHVNERRLGMLGNTNRAFALARERHPRADYWALGSDHDLWHPRFVETLVDLLERHPDALLAYPLVERIDEHGRRYPGAKTPKAFDTLGVTSRFDRLGIAFRRMAAGNMVYGMFRAHALDPMTIYRPVLVPDRLLLSELALRGPFVAAPQPLWQRRFRGLADLERQRRAFFPEGAPRYARLPWWLQHAGALTAAYVFDRGGEDAGLGRAGGARLVTAYLRMALTLRFRRRIARVRRWFRRYLPHRVARRLAHRLIERHGEAAGMRLRAILAAIKRRRRLSPLVDRTILARLDRRLQRSREHA